MRFYWLKAFFSVLILSSFLFNSIPLMAQGEIVTSEDIGGSSVFVFRRSNKAPQAKFAPKAKPQRGKKEKTETRKALVIQAKVVTPKRQKVVITNTKPKATPKPTVKPSPGGKKTPTPKPTPDIETVSPEDASNTMGAGAEVLLERGEIDKAIEMFKEAISLYEGNSLAKGGLSEALTQKGNNVFEKDGADLSVRYYEDALKYNPNNSEALAGLGAVYEELNDEPKAFDYYQKAVAINPNLTELYAPLGIGYYQRGEIAKAEALLTKAIATRNDNYQTQFLLGLINYKLNKDAQAETAFKETIRLNKDLAEAYYFLGEIYDRNNRANEAFEKYNQAVQVNPKYAEAWFDLGVAYFNRERYQEAAEAYRKTLQFNNSNYEAHANLADVYRILGYNIVAKNKKDQDDKKAFYQQSEASYRTATDQAENNSKAKEDRTGMAEIYSKYGFVLGRLNKWDGAVAALNKAISYQPDAFDYSNVGWAYYNAAQVDFVKKQPDVAKSKLQLGRDALQKAVAMDSKSRAAYLNLGVTLNDLGEYNGAIDAFKKALSLQDNWYVAINELGIAYKGAGNLGEAVKQFTRAAELAERELATVKTDFQKSVANQNIASSLFNLAVSEIERGNEKEARKAQDKLKKYDPNRAQMIEVMILNKLKSKVENKIQEKNPLNRIRIPF